MQFQPIATAAGNAAAVEIHRIHPFRLRSQPELAEDFALHRSINRSGWTLTHCRSGVAVARGASQRATLEQFGNAIRTLGGPAIADKLDALPTIEAPKLSAHVIQPQPRKRAVDLQPVVDAIIARLHADGHTLPEGTAAAVRAALSTRTGRLKAQAPAEPLAKAAWNGLQPNAYKIQFSSCFLRGDAAALLRVLSTYDWPVELDKDAAALAAAGVWR